MVGTSYGTASNTVQEVCVISSPLDPSNIIIHSWADNLITEDQKLWPTTTSVSESLASVPAFAQSHSQSNSSQLQSLTPSQSYSPYTPSHPTHRFQDENANTQSFTPSFNAYDHRQSQGAGPSKPSTSRPRAPLSESNSRTSLPSMSRQFGGWHND